MSVLFARSSSEYAEYAGAPVTTRPFSISVWYYPTSFSSDATIFSVSEIATFYFHTLLVNTSGYATAGDFGSGGVDVATGGAPALSTLAWNHLVAVFASPTSRTIYWNGSGNKVTNTGNSGTGPTIDYTTISGNHFSGSVSDQADGRIAEVTLYDFALSDDQVDILFERHWPLIIQRSGIKHYWEMPGNGGPSRDQFGGLDMTWYNTPVVADHPPLIYPAESIVIPVSEGIDLGNISRFPANLLGI